MDNLPINAVDLAILIVVLLSGLLAFSRGLVHEFLGLIAWVGAALVTLHFFLPAQEVARDIIAIEILADIAAGLALFLVALFFFSIISRTIGKRVRESSIGFLDRSLGLLFGIARGALIVCLLWLVFAWLMPPADRPQWVQNARALPMLEDGADLIREIVPKELMLPGEDTGKSKTVNPVPPLQPGTGDNGSTEEESGGYTDDTRRELNRLMEQQQ
ncbi:CvpA family protein [Fodinicurvata sediminis]|uniref:CvpA family protein n=1 Tax=Fodinicurvata sediminis TaxID=1121832 RepID=UPI0003B5828C|nr:CvpA family protein [Fodinicurvata sediminis]